MSCSNEVTNFMGGKSFKLFNPLNNLKLVAFSSFLGEPTYYQPVNKDIESPKTNSIYNNEILKEYLLIPDDFGVSRNEKFYNATIAALEYDFEKTLELAVKCRNEYLMRRSSAQILAIAAAQKKRRIVFNDRNPKVFREILKKCWLLPGDAIACLDAWKALFGSKTKFPSFIKRAYEDRLRELSAYQQEKYRKESISMVRLCHASKSTLKFNDTLSTLMENGSLDLEEKDIKWEKHRSLGKSWTETLNDMEWRMPHMAALRNIRSFAASDPGIENMNRYLEMLLAGVEGGKQFPFRYMTAYKKIKNNFENQEASDEDLEKSEIKEVKTNKKRKIKTPSIVKLEYKENIFEYLEKCLQKSIENYPILDGDVISLTDNSGSAHGTMTSTYGSSTVSDIGNLSALFTAYRASGRGVVGVFGDDLKLYEVDKSKTLLEQYNEIKDLAKDVGGSTENGVWLFFKRAFNNSSSYKFDHWFCYSDMQVGHGGLYGNDPEILEQDFFWGNKKNHRLPVYYVDIHKCVEKYRKEINPKLNTYMVQTAGYDNSILPESTYRGAILSGWTGNEVVYAKQLSKLWDEIESVV